MYKRITFITRIFGIHLMVRMITRYPQFFQFSALAPIQRAYTNFSQAGLPDPGLVLMGQRQIDIEATLPAILERFQDCYLDCASFEMVSDGEKGEDEVPFPDVFIILNDEKYGLFYLETKKEVIQFQNRYKAMCEQSAYRLCYISRYPVVLP